LTAGIILNPDMPYNIAADMLLALPELEMNLF